MDKVVDNWLDRSVSPARPVPTEATQIFVIFVPIFANLYFYHLKTEIYFLIILELIISYV